MAIDQELIDFDQFYKIGEQQHLTHELPKHLQKPQHSYFLAIYKGGKFPPNHMKTLYDVGWRLLYTTGNTLILNEKDPKSKENIRPAPLTVDLKNGCKAVWLEIPTKVLKEHLENQVKLNKRKNLQNVKRISRYGTYQMIDGGEINNHDLNESV